jgi:lipoic acid synthetase
MQIDHGFRMGFKYVASGPMVRSSYKAGEYYIKNILRQRSNESIQKQTTMESFESPPLKL